MFLLWKSEMPRRSGSIYLVLWTVWIVCSVNAHCPRDFSRLVRRTLNQEFYPVYEEYGAEVPLKCPFHKSYDLYGVQESHKVMEYGAQWNCDFCGKSFYSEEYIDQHFESKHANKLVKESAVCLSDYCDLFRCEIYKLSFKDLFWEKSLCEEHAMETRKKRCQALLHTCLPLDNTSAPHTYSHLVYDSVSKRICSKLNCKDYWKNPDQEVSAGWVIYYVTVTPFFLVGLLIYYYHVWEYYCLNTGQDVESWRDSVDHIGGPRQGSVKRRRLNYMGDVHMY